MSLIQRLGSDKKVCKLEILSPKWNCLPRATMIAHTISSERLAHILKFAFTTPSFKLSKPENYIPIIPNENFKDYKRRLEQLGTEPANKGIFDGYFGEKIVYSFSLTSDIPPKQGLIVNSSFCSYGFDLEIKKFGNSQLLNMEWKQLVDSIHLAWDREEIPYAIKKLKGYHELN
jgi:hypothetical protein